MFHRGNVTLSGLLAVFFVFTFFMIIVYQGQMSVKKIKRRAHAHLCFRFYMAKTLHYIKKVNEINRMISAGFSLSLLPGGEIAGKSVDFFKGMQTIHHLAYLEGIMSYRFCSLTQRLNHIKSLPYEMKGRFLFKRSGMKTTIMRWKKWKRVMMQGNVLLKTLWRVRDSFDTEPELSVMEIAVWH